MATNEYHLTTDWRFLGTAREVSDLLSDATAMARWWRAFIIDLEERAPGDAQGVGKVIALHVKGWLPYELRWQFRVTESHAPHGFSIAAWGDLNGRGQWTITEDGDYVNVHYDWLISADRPLLRYGSFALKPLFASNHRWAMERGAEGIRLELERMRAQTPAARDAVPLPPLPARNVPGPLIAAVAAIGVSVALRRRARERSEVGSHRGDGPPVVDSGRARRRHSRRMSGDRTDARRPSMATEKASAPQFFQVSGLPETHPLPGLTARFVAGDKLHALFGRAEPNASLPLHSHPHEQISYVLEGQMHFQVGDAGYDLGPGDGLAIPGGVTHGAIRVGPEGASFVEIFTPLRDEYVALMRQAAQET